MRSCYNLLSHVVHDRLQERMENGPSYMCNLQAEPCEVDPWVVLEMWSLQLHWHISYLIFKSISRHTVWSEFLRWYIQISMESMWAYISCAWLCLQNSPYSFPPTQNTHYKVRDLIMQMEQQNCDTITLEGHASIGVYFCFQCGQQMNIWLSV